MREETYDSEESLFTSESGSKTLLKLKEPQGAKKTELTVNPIENFEIIPDKSEKARPRIIVSDDE